ncbi:MAG: 4'-phosphopantetheinyl transferase superfamily protein [Bradymonadaceae bacterium]|nr:4'-phosphopantetheinyl transferase superfamily protein [Lujinxingiaceae bacterium]
MSSEHGAQLLCEPEGDQVHLWVVRTQAAVEPAILERYRALLSAQERAQYGRFLRARDSHRYLVTRALVRSVLSRYRERSPEQWCFDQGPHGRPQLQGAGKLRFNLSHTNAMVVLALGCEREIGVDVEDAGRSCDMLNIAAHYFSPGELACLRALEGAELRRCFFSLWTLKEAYIKARGIGFALALDQFSFQIDASGRIGMHIEASLGDDAGSWQFWQLEVGDDHILALAIRAAAEASLSLTIRTTLPLVKEQIVAHEAAINRRSALELG